MSRGSAGLAVLALLAATCVREAGSPIDPSAPPADGNPLVYVAIGASETVGVGTRDPFTQAWPKVLWRDALPQAVLYDLGRPGSTLGEALVEQLPQALELQPDVATIWLNVNDLVERVPAYDYERDLRSMVGAMTATGADVLVASTPRIDSLPVYLACLPDPPPDARPCPARDVSLPTPARVRASVDAYNEAITRVAFETGAIVVDLQAYGNAPRAHPAWIADDGFHPSAAGAEAIAAAFADALPAALRAAASAPR
jgi:lysophospholipase L1-like esterase